jgi:C1A family cysteine protease
MLLFRMNIFKRSLTVVLAIFILISNSSLLAGTSLVAYSDEPIATKIQQVINPEYEQYITDLQNGNSARWGDHIPSAFLPSKQINSGLKMSLQSISPAAYDSRNVGGISYITPVKNQLSTGTCWDFAAMATVEAKFKRSLAVTKIVSEEHTRWTLSNLFPYVNNGPRFDRSPVDGGNFDMVAAYLTSGLGSVLSSDVPFTDPHGHTETLADKSPNFFTASIQADIRGIDISIYDATAIKQSIMNNGAVVASIYADNDMYPSYNTNKYFNKTTNSYFCNVGGDSTHITNHDITFVGWDDNYSRNNFAATKPTNNGAWIVKNSWGTSWGSSGYFYLSYDEPETKMNEIGSISDMALHNPVNKIYIADESGMISTDGWDNTTESLDSANIFANDNFDKYLKSVMIATDSNFQGKIKIGQGNSIIEARQNSYYNSDYLRVTKSNSGYATYDLSTPVQLTGAFFSIEVDIAPGLSKIGVETPILGLNSSAIIQKGTSYMINPITRQWEDIGITSNENLCIRGIVCTDVTVAPTGLALQNKTETTADLSWNAVIGADSYNVYQGSTKLNASPITNTAFSVTGLTQNTGYSFTVKAVDTVGESLASNSLAVTTTKSISFPVYNVIAAKVLTNIARDTSVDTFYHNVTLGPKTTLTITNYSGKTLLSTDFIGTGTTVDVKIGNIKDSTYTIRLYGDVNGDGLINLNDLVSIRNNLLGIQSLTDIFIKAGDLYHENTITLNDLVGIMAYLSEVGTINQNQLS